MLKSYKTLSIVTVVFALFAVISFVFKIDYLTSVSFWGIFIYLLIICNKKSILRTTTIETAGAKEKAVIVVVCILLILLCILPMELAPFWNGRIPMHRNQYELLADSMLNGHIYIDYDDIDPKLLTMDNPYSWQERIDNEVIYHWDHAFYNGHYYMYFGVVPVFLLFIPFKLITGKTLVTFHATQFFVMMAIIAFFILFYLIAKKYFSKLPLCVYILVTSAICLITLGYCVQAPALYCTAISGGVCFMLWSILFYFCAVMYAKKTIWQVSLATLGALAGALAFGCRPPAALGNLLAIPLAIYYAKNNKGKHLVSKFIIIAIPYLIVGALLMLYNYLRFENPFEFGQAYQLTSADQTVYTSFWDNLDVASLLSGLNYNFLYTAPISNTFPYFNYGGFLVTYPLMWLMVLYLVQDKVREAVKNDGIKMMVWFTALVPVIITLVDSFWAPGLCERYRLDAYYIVGILAFLAIGYRIKTVSNKETTISLVCVFSVISILITFLLFMQPCDANFAEYLPEAAENVRKAIMFERF